MQTGGRGDDLKVTCSNNIKFRKKEKRRKED